MSKLLLDTNVILDFIIRKQGENFVRAQNIFEKVEAGKIKVFLSILIVSETIWAIEKYYKINRAGYFQNLVDLFSLKGIKIIEIKKKELSEIFKILWQKNVSFPDAYLAYLSQNQGQVISFDKDFVKLGAKIYKCWDET